MGRCSLVASNIIVTLNELYMEIKDTGLGLLMELFFMIHDKWKGPGNSGRLSRRNATDTSQLFISPSHSGDETMPPGIVRGATAEKKTPPEWHYSTNEETGVD